MKFTPRRNNAPIVIGEKNENKTKVWTVLPLLRYYIEEEQRLMGYSEVLPDYYTQDRGGY